MAEPFNQFAVPNFTKSEFEKVSKENIAEEKATEDKVAADATVEVTKKEKQVEDKTKEIIKFIQKEATECLEKASVILKVSGGESNIPINSEYWELMNRYRSLSN